MGGSFVADHARLVSRLAERVDVVHAQEWPAGPPSVVATLQPAFDRVLAAAAAAGTLRVTGAVGQVARVPVFIVGGEDVPARAEAAVRDVCRALGRVGGDAVHGHVGYLGGLLAARLAEPGVPVFATEHSTGLADVLASPRGRDQYGEVLQRCTRLFCVSGLLRDQVLDVLPEFADRVEVMPNPVDFTGVPRRRTPPAALRRWVFVGGLIERKGVERLVRAFTTVARQDPDVTLTMYGQGPLRERLLGLARDAGVADRLELAGVLRHGELLARLPRYDLVMAPSTFETFHLVVPEAVAAGVPLITTRSGGPQESLAGVEALVGRVVDVDDTPDLLLDAYRDLAAHLDDLDLDEARRTLDGRYGRDAVAHRLAAAYGVPASAVATAEAAPTAGEREPARPVVLLAASGWRRYSVREELAAARKLGTPVAMVTRDPEITELAAGLPVAPPEALARSVEPLADRGRARLRRAAGALRRRLRRLPPAPRPPRGAVLPPGSLDGATVVVTDIQSMPFARALLDGGRPTLRVAFELDRGGDLGPAADVAERV
jgi:glycogen(starch) synthase